MVYFRLFAAVALASANVAPVAAQVLPPPLLPGQSDITQRLVAAFRAKDERAYAALLSDQVEVFEDGKKIASDKAEWLRRFGPMLSADGVYFKLAPGYAATGRFLLIEYFNSMASWGLVRLGIAAGVLTRSPMISLMARSSVSSDCAAVMRYWTKPENKIDQWTSV